MTGTERIKAMMAKKPFDRVGVSGWVHLPMVDHNVKDMVRATIGLTDYCDWDFVKLMSTGHYITEMYGGDITPSVNPHSWVGKINRFAITNLEELKNIKVLDKDNPVIRREVAIAAGVCAHYKGTKPVIATIFTPLTCLQEMMSRGTNEKLLPLMKEHPQEVKDALVKLVQTNKNYLDALIEEAGIDGIFFANQYMSTNVITPELFDVFCTPYDCEVLDYIKERTWFNVLHVHGENNLMFDKALLYNVQAYSWENCAPGVPEETLASVEEVRKLTDKILITGLARHYDYYSETNNREDLKKLFKARLKVVMDQSKDQRVIFAPGCALPLDVDKYVFTLMREVVLEDGEQHNG